VYVFTENTLRQKKETNDESLDPDLILAIGHFKTKEPGLGALVL